LRFYYSSNYFYVESNSSKGGNFISKLLELILLNLGISLSSLDKRVLLLREIDLLRRGLG